MRLSETVVLLTGASGGIGLQLAEQLCTSGARVLAVSRQRGGLDRLLAQYPQQLSWQAADLRSSQERQQVATAAAAMGGINLLINGAGANHFALLEQLSE